HGLIKFMQQRQPGRASVRVVNPETGFAGRSLVQVVTDDMPFLVDTVTMNVSQWPIHAVIHPVLKLSRDAAGKLKRLGEDGDTYESVMHFEIDRVAGDGDLAQLQAQLEGALDD